jgi:thiol-disulfide isomerase/thioredoxin
MSAPSDVDSDTLEVPRTNPVPLIVAAVVALVILGGLAVLLFGGDEDDDVADLSQDGPGATLDPDEVAATGERAPDVTFSYLDGSGPDQPEGRFSDFEGAPLVVNFFAEWCAPCVAEMPDLQTVFEEYEGEVAFLGIATNDTRQKAHRIVRQTGVTYTTAFDETGEGVLAAFQGFAMPTTVFIDADGNVRRIWSGQISAAELRQAIEQDLLG